MISLLSTNYDDISFAATLNLIPKKDYDAYPKASQDGAGFCSSPDWSERRVKQSHPDIFSAIRKKWMPHIISHRWDRRLLAHIAAQHNQPLFSDEEVEMFRTDINDLLTQAGQSPDWSIPQDQPTNHCVCMFCNSWPA